MTLESKHAEHDVGRPTLLGGTVSLTFRSNLVAPTDTYKNR